MVNITIQEPNIIQIINQDNILNKKLLIVCSQHGDEITPILLGYELLETLKCIPIDNYIFQIFSTITIINGANIKALQHQSRSYKQTNNDYNRSYEFDKTITDPEYIKSLVQQYDFIIDVHSSKHITTPFVLLDDDMYAQSLIDYFNKININYVLLNGNVNETSLKSYTLKHNDHLFNNDSKNHKIGFLSSENIKIGLTLELNGLYCGDKSHSVYGTQMIINILNNINDLYLSNESTQQCNYSILINNIKEGMFLSSIELPTIKQKIIKDEQLGIIKNLINDQIADIKSPISGTLLLLSNNVYLNNHDNISIIQPDI